ncbi:GNAT family N-acetyltransferase [Gloeobacter kilaueensis]|uniref:GCN5-related N-acetyltransferase n=1 Tax=Gloeobacter kilaueensis (strain ATCC BAA-2537 / CCAP 1431/1 / ULC 316 / JS1) TaxID=1183438 RepID=U5QH57_GLOK1|nr:N-acetyltransferase [Gloeobacter kilaueensis]AGY56949.1 GCN5-related N-acetyltransferase [Gloeobacter kilaueensis JS1]
MKSFELSSEQEANEPAFTIRPAIAEDAGSIAAILTECFHPPVGLTRWIQPWIQAGLKAEISLRLRTPPAFYSCLVALVEEHTAGTVEVALRSLPQQWWMPPGLGGSTRLAYISNLAVSNTYRRQGVARALLLEVEKLVRRWNQSTVNLHVMERNRGALALYYGLGYQLERTEQEWPLLGDRKLLLHKKLSA